ncbi:MAG: PBP1A family penicillin-binding protein [Campylobacterales bacterium]|nr:PBP1A family penicillin-binding protein [Campylobacterales bacterium]
MRRVLGGLFWTFVWLSVLIPLGLVTYFLNQFGYQTQVLVEYKPQLTTRIYDRNNELIANVFAQEHRQYVGFDAIPPRLIEALLAIEDTTFFEHPGVNVDAIFRALIKDLQAGKMVEGASTITQQLIKNTLLTREKKLSRKLKEVLLALKLERELSKEEILERYLNEVYLGHGYYGVRTAAEGYFRKPLGQLTLKEMAILVGLPKAPSYYAPTKNYELSLGRANRVIARMFDLGWIDVQDYEAALRERPEVFDDTLTLNRAPYVVDEVLRQYGTSFEDLRIGGYEIHTTIDLALQSAARDALKHAYDLALDRAGEADAFDPLKLNGALVSVEAQSGDVLALVGGVDYRQSSYNRATQGLRQSGSAFKPFLYQAALDMGYSPATQLFDVARTYAYQKEGETQKWQPKNYEKDYEGVLTLREALVHSRNLATINLVTDIGLSSMLEELKRYGMSGLPQNLSLSLGSYALSPLEMAKYYSVFANSGVIVEPLLVRSIVNRFGSSVAYESKRRYVTTPEQTYLMTSILRDVVLRGTGKNAKVEGIELAGKTGTTNNAVDAWFAGYSPEVQTVVWFGNDDNTPMRSRETGGRVAAPAFAYYYRQLITLYPQTKRHFEMPEGVIRSRFGGREEFFTERSKPPVQPQESEGAQELIF